MMKVFTMQFSLSRFLYLCLHCTSLMEVQNVMPVPGAGESKKNQVKEMFDRIAGRYDLLNHLLSANIDKRWRTKCIRILKNHQPARVLDVASGTGDLAIAAAALKPEKIVATDLSEGMLEIAEKKIKESNLQNIIETKVADGENLPFEDNSFDAVMIAFGIRNFGNIGKGIREFYRVLKPGGVLLILEFSMPPNFIVRSLYLFYFRHILPLIGRSISGDKTAYLYLNRSVEAFPRKNVVLGIMQESGFRNGKTEALSMGISCIYTGIK